MHLFLPDLLSDSHMNRSTTHFSKPLLCVTLIGGDRSDDPVSCVCKAIVIKMTIKMNTAQGSGYTCVV